MTDVTGRAWCAPQAKEAPKLKLFNSFTKQKVRSRRVEWLWRAPAGLLLGIVPGTKCSKHMACLQNACRANSTSA